MDWFRKVYFAAIPKTEGLSRQEKAEGASRSCFWTLFSLCNLSWWITTQGAEEKLLG